MNRASDDHVENLKQRIANILSDHVDLVDFDTGASILLVDDGFHFEVGVVALPIPDEETDR